jgi:hypothetical protein
MMRDDPRHLPETTLSAGEVKRVLERAAQIDATQQTLSVSDLTTAAGEAGISEAAVRQAVQELLENRQLMPTADPGGSAAIAHASKARPWLIGVTSGLSLLIGLILISFILRMFP